MRIGLIDVDSHRFPNLPLMKLSAWHKARGDEVEWYDPKIGAQNEYDIVFMSKVFSFTPDYACPVYAQNIVRGGSGYCISLMDGKEIYDISKDNQLSYEVEHIYPDYPIYQEKTKDTAYGFLTRGCPRGCGFCHVEAKEGRGSYKVADLNEFWKGQRRIILCDPNILACSEYPELFQQLIDSGARVNFNQGLDIRLINDENIALLKRIRLDRIHFAFDCWQDKDIIERNLRRFAKETGYNKDKGRVMVYILVNYDTTLEQDLYRIQLCRELRFSPYPMIYDKEHAASVYRKMQRWCSNFIFWKVPTFEEYKNAG